MRKMKETREVSTEVNTEGNTHGWYNREFQCRKMPGVRGLKPCRSKGFSDLLQHKI